MINRLFSTLLFCLLPITAQLQAQSSGPISSPIDRIQRGGGSLIFDSSGDSVLTGGFTATLTGNADTATALAANPTDCSADEYATTIAADGDLTCAGVKINELNNPDGNAAFNMTTRQLKYTWTNPATSDGALELEASGAFSGDLMHVHQHTGNPSAVDLLHLEAEDADVVPLRLTGAGTYDIISGPISVEGVSNNNSTEGGTGRLNLTTWRDQHTLAGAATSTTTDLDIPSGSLLVACQLTVDTEVGDDDGNGTWGAAYNAGGQSQAITAAGTAKEVDTKVNTFFDANANSAITDAETQIIFTPNGTNFDAGVIEILCHGWTLTSMADAP